MAAENKPRKSSDISDPAPSLCKFLYKALVVVVVIIVVPLFPSRAPEFVNQSLFTRGWELVHLLFVGIAVCYGLFSRRNEDDPQKDGFETSVSRFLQASSSVFDDQFDGSGGENSSSNVQSWSSQCSRNEPLVVVAAADDGESRGMVSRSMRTRILGVNDKPLLLPVRSLKSTRVLDSAQADANLLFRRSNSNEGGDDNVVLRSPIPWRGRTEIKEEAEGYDVSHEYAFRPVISRSDQQRASNSDSPKSSSPSPSTDLSNRPLGHMLLVSPELLATKAEDGSRKSFYNPSPPPAPPLPPSKHHKPESSLMYSSSGRGGSRMGMAAVKEFTHVPSSEDSSTSVREEMIRRLNSRNPRSNVDNALMVGKSVRTARSGESLAVHKKPPQEMVTEGYWKDVMEAPKEPTGSERKLLGINQLSMRNEKSDPAMEVPQRKEEKAVPEDIVTIESDCESESEDEDIASEILSSFKRQEPEPVNQAMADFGPDVDKKADEFIAKFREQIRLQRIESIKRSTYQVTGKVT